jgi:hypothetical protein
MYGLLCSWVSFRAKLPIEPFKNRPFDGFVPLIGGLWQEKLLVAAIFFVV